jgi:ABC-2 type transport system permease protein
VTFRALGIAEIRRLLSRRAVWFVMTGLLFLALAVVGVAAVRSTGTGPLDHTMRLSSLWVGHGSAGPSQTLVLAMSVYAFLGVVGIAATAVGGEYRAGTVGTLLTWEPRRHRVLAARLLAVAVVATVVYLTFALVFVGGWWLGATMRGSTEVPAGFWPELLYTVARCTVVAVLLAELTAAVAFVTRSTVGAILVWFAYLVGVEGILAGRVPELRTSLLAVNLVAFLQSAPVRIEEGGFGDPARFAEPGPGIVLVAVFTVAVVAAGLVLFRRRDVQ